MDYTFTKTIARRRAGRTAVERILRWITPEGTDRAKIRWHEPLATAELNAALAVLEGAGLIGRRKERHGTRGRTGEVYFLLDPNKAMLEPLARPEHPNRDVNPPLKEST